VGSKITYINNVPETSGMNIKQVLLNFSYPPIRTKVFTVTDNAVTPTSKIVVFNGNSDTDTNEESFNYSINSKSGSFDITFTGETKIGGNFKINYICQ